MGFLAGRTTAGSRRRGRLPILVALVAALVITIASQAQAHVPYTAVAWGQNGRGTLGNGSTTSSNVPVAVSNLSGITAIASEHGPAFYGQALALLENGTVWGWGRNDEGQVGDGTKADKDVPVAVCAAGSTLEQCQKGAHLGGVKAIAAGSIHSLALLENGTVVEWGSPGDGGGGVVPAAKSGLSGVRAIAAGNAFSLALLENGTVMAWGANGSAQLGNGTEAESKEPVAVCAVGEKAPCVNHLSGVKGIAAGESWGLAVLENGTVVGWGRNSEGQLGNGEETKSAVPVTVCAVGATSPCATESQQLKGVTAVAAGQDQSVALLETRTVVAWGGPDLGNGTSTKSDTPVPVCATGEPAPCANDLSGVTGIAAGGEHPTASYALLESGNVMAWGNGSWYELGDGSNTSTLVPVAVCAPNEKAPCAKDLIGAKGIAAGDEQGFAFGPFPAVTAIVPKAGPDYGGTQVSITGGNFSEVSAVKFGSANAKSFTVNSENSITAISPVGAGTVDVTVTTSAGTSGTSPADQFSYEMLPELGRCVKVATKGAYKASSCVVQAPEHNGAYEWAPGPGAKRGFSGQSTTPKLETVAKHTVQCTAGHFGGEWTGAKTALVKLSFSGCTTIIGGKAEPCQTNANEASVIRTEPLEAELGFITTEGLVPKLGLDLKLPKSPSVSVLTFTCGSGPPPVGEQWVVEGSVIGGITPVDVMKPVFDPLYRALAAKQIPERFQGEPNDTLLVSRLNGGGKHEEQAGLTMPGTEKRFFELGNEEPLELKVK